MDKKDESVQNIFLRFPELLEKQINLTFRTGGFIASILGYSCALLIFITEFTHLTHDLLLPGIWALISGAYSTIIYISARNNQIKNWFKYVLILLFVSLPSVIYIIAHFILPSGTATYITGPPSYLYFFLIVMTGFLFDSRISAISGLVACLQYLLFYCLAAPHLAHLQHPDPLIVQDLTQSPMYFFKSFMMLFTGFLTGAISNNSKELLKKILAEEHEKQRIDKLFGQYVSDSVKDKIITEKKDIIGEKVETAILFSDIRSFSTLSEDMKPEDVVMQLNEYLEQMVECINSEGGVIDKFMGDAIMATFGGVLALKNPGESAVKAAVKMQQTLLDLNQSWERRGLKSFSIGIGIHYGEVLQGTLGSKERKEFTVIGDVVNTSSRMESLTKEYPYGIIFSEKIYDALAEDLKEKSYEIGEMNVKGKTKKIRCFGLAV